MRLIGSVSILRRSTRIFFEFQSSSAMSVGVTEPKREPVGPALTSNRSTAAERASALAIVRALGDVREQRHLTRPLHGGRHLHLVPAARARDAAAADLALLGDVAAQLGDVLVVDLRDLLLAEEAVAAPDLPRRPAG